MTDLPDLFLDYDAAYVMGALDPHDRRAFETHLIGCTRCTAAVSELAGMPGLLAQVPTEQVLNPSSTAAGPVPDTLLPRMAATLRREQRRRRTWSGVLGSAAAAVLIVGTVLVTGALSNNTHDAADPAHPTATASPTAAPLAETALIMTATKPIPVTATLRLDSLSWGTRINLSCTYLDDDSPTPGPPQKWTYRLVVVPRDGGAVQQVAQWTATSGRTEMPTGSTDLRPDQIREIRLLDSRGDTLLHATPRA